MKYIKLLHNPTAGDEGHTKKKLTPLIEEAGWECRYSSTKEKGWEIIEPDTEFIAVAGGDGTIRKAALTLLDRKFSDKKLPIAILPLGTANNISKSLGITGEVEDIIATWKTSEVKKYDIGRIEGLDKIQFRLWHLSPPDESNEESRERKKRHAGESIADCAGRITSPDPVYRSTALSYTDRWQRSFRQVPAGGSDEQSLDWPQPVVIAQCRSG
jgi:hypothetical protein